MKQELTWEDCRRIVKIADRLISNLDYLNKTEQEYYEMIANEFNSKENESNR